MGKILVVGSANADLMIATPNLPKPGETVRGHDFLVAPGGKGANQATAAARLGGDVSFIGSIGDDDFGRSIRTSLFDSGVDTAYLGIRPSSATGVALILSETSGENIIAIAAGANELLLPADIDAAANAIAEATARRALASAWWRHDAADTAPAGAFGASGKRRADARVLGGFVERAGRWRSPEARRRRRARAQKDSAAGAA